MPRPAHASADFADRRCSGYALGMLRARRSAIRPSVEITPLIDVVFLLLTFFVFALILTVRMDATDIRLPEVRSGAESPTTTRPVVVGMNADGEISIGDTVLAGASDAIGPATSGAIFRALIESAGLVESSVRSGEADLPTLMLAIDEEARHGRILELLDALRETGVSDFRYLRSPNRDGPAG